MSGSWVVASACCFINTMMFGSARITGMLFVASVARFGVTREQASFPYTFSNFVRNTAGPLTGYLGEKLGIRPVTSFGCLLAGIGVGACFLAEDINLITIFWGLTFGLGFGLGSILLPVKINEHFDKHRATASGVSFSGACLGSFLLPPLVEKLLDVYGLSGTFLILSGLVLNCVPAALLLREPDSTRPSESQVILKKVKLYTVESDDVMFTSLSHEERMKRLSTQTLLSTYSVRMSTPDALVDVEQILENSKGRRRVDQDALVECGSIASSTADSVFGQVLVEDDKWNAGQDNPAFKRSLSELYVNGAPLTEKNNAGVVPSSSSNKSNAFSVFFDPVFVLLAVANAIYVFIFICCNTVIVDFARDLRVPRSSEKYVLMSLSVGDFVGRIGLGFVTDRGHMSTTTFAATCFLCQGVSIAAIAWSTGFGMLTAISFLYGLSEAGLMVIFPLIMAQYLDQDKHTVAISSFNFLAGPTCLTIPPLIGFFRDKVGSYNFIFLGMGAASIFCCLSFLLFPLIAKNKRPAK